MPGPTVALGLKTLGMIGTSLAYSNERPVVSAK